MSESKMPESIDQTACTDIDAANDGLWHPDTELTKDHTEDTGLTEDRTDTAPPTLTVETSTPIVPDGGWGWFIVLGSFLVHLVMGGFERSNGVMYLQLLSKYDRTATETSWVLSIFSTLRLAVGPVASALCNKYSCRTVVIMGAVISTLGIFISAYVPDLPFLYITYGVLGVSLLMPSMTSFYGFATMSALYGVLSGTYISQKSVVAVDVLGVESLSSSFGLLLLFQGVSAIIGPTSGGMFKDLLGSYDMSFYFGSIGIIAGGVTMAVGNIWLYRQKKKSLEKKESAA